MSQTDDELLKLPGVRTHLAVIGYAAPRLFTFINRGGSEVPISRDAIVPYSSIILDSFDSHDSILECARQLKIAGLQFNDSTDLAKESEFLETVKDIALQAALKDNKDVKPSEFAIDFLLIMNGRMELNRRAFVALAVGIDSVLNHDVKATRDVKSGLKTAIAYIKKSHPTVLTWLPLKYQQFVRTFRGV